MGVYTVKLRIGVINMPYDYGYDPGKTTFEVAARLERDYHLFSGFYRRYQQDILQEVRDRLVRNFSDTVKYGCPVIADFPLPQAGRNFNDFLTLQLVEQKGYGLKGWIPTDAALWGVNSRLKLKMGPRRPSFIDGGLLKASTVIWVETNA